MNSSKHIKQLKSLGGRSKRYNLRDLVDTFERQRKESIAIEVGIATELGLRAAYGLLNVDDDLFQAYAAAYPSLNESTSLYEKALEEVGSADPSEMSGLLSGVKGKLFEQNLETKLEQIYPGWEFNIAPNVNQSVWDLTGVAPDGKVMFVQAKMGRETYANDVHERMLENPDVMFATSTEIQEKILEKSPELADQFIAVDLSNMEFSTDVADGVSQLVANAGLDVPDSFGDSLPFVGEVVAAFTLHKELVKVNFDYAQISDFDRRKVKALRAIHVAGKYAAFSGGAALGAAIGSALLPVVGTILGGIGGFAYMKWIKNDIVAELDRIGKDLLNINTDNLYYENRKSAINRLAMLMRRKADDHVETLKLIVG
jgi:hypothetical protein